MTSAYNDWNIFKESLNIFLSRCSTKAVNSIDKNNQALRLLLVTFDINVVVGLDLWGGNALVSPVF